MARPRMPLEERLKDKFLIGEGCWEWISSQESGRRPRFSIGSERHTSAYRIMYELYVGPIPDGYVIDHLCRNPICVRPDHLEAVTPQENTRRGIGGQVAAERQLTKTHCPKGHKYDAVNTYVDPAGRRRCIECRKRWM